MPYAKNAYERTERIYKKLLKEAIMKIDSDYETRIKGILIRTEIQKRDFTKRQLNILSLIITFSYTYGKESAMLKPSDFSICGIPTKKITGELKQLIEMNVLHWDNDFSEFTIIEPRFWNAPFHDHFDEQRQIELFLLNLRHAGIDPTEIIEELNKKNNN